MKRVNKNFKKKAAAFLAIFLAFLMLLSAIAPFIFASSNLDSEISITAELGYSGLYKVGYPTPLSLEISVGSNGFIGEVLIRVPMHDKSYMGEAQYIDYAYPLNMGANEKKSVKMDVTINTIVSFWQLKAEMVDSSGVTRALSALATVPFNPDNMMIGFLSDNPDNLSYIKATCIDKIMQGYSSKHTADLSSLNFPDTLGALNAFNIIFINDFDTSRLSDTAKSSLQGWVSSGGLLFVGTGENYQKTMKGLEGFIHVEKAERLVTDNIDSMLLDWEETFYLEESHQEEYSTVDEKAEEAKRADAARAAGQMANSPNLETNTKSNYTNAYINEKVLASPIVLENANFLEQVSSNLPGPLKSVDFGMGRILLFHFDLGNSAVSKSRRLSAFISEITQSEADYVKNNIAYSNSRSHNNYIINPYNLSTIPNQDSWIIDIFLLLVIIYIIAVGPILYLFLKKKDRKEAGFIIIPISSLGVTVLIFIMSFNTIYKRPVINEITKTYISDGQSNATKTGNVAILSARKGTIPVAITDDKTNLNPFLDNYYNGYSYYGYGNYKPIKITYGEEPGIVYYDNERWDTNVFGTTSEVELGGEIFAKMSVENGAYVGVIQNETPYDLKEVVISFGNKGYRNMGNIEAWGELTINEAISSATPFIRDTYTLVWGEDDYFNNGIKSKQEELELWHKNMFRLMLENEINNNNYSSHYPGAYSSSGSKFGGSYQNKVTDVKMLTYTTAPLGSFDLSVSGVEPVKYYNNLLAMDIECTVNLGKKYDLPFGYIGISEIISQGYYDISYDYGMYVYDTNEVEFIIDLSEYTDLNLFQFSDKLKMNDRSETVIAQILNVKTGDWEELTYSQYLNVSEYINEKGQLIIKIDCTNLNHINIPEIRITGGR